MPIDHSVTDENFRFLLSWLDPDPDTAAKEYERIRVRLIRLFSGRGCYDAEMLADRTIDRVTVKAQEIVNRYVGRPDLYFYGVAKNIHKEWLREKERENRVQTIVVSETDDNTEREFDCLEACLNELSIRNREVVVEYYQNEKRAKIDARKKIAERLGISIGALQVRVSRIRSQLLICVSECVSRD